MNCVETAIRMQDKRRNMTERELALKAGCEPAAVVTDGVGTRIVLPAGDKEKQGSSSKEPMGLVPGQAVFLLGAIRMEVRREKPKVEEKTT